MSDQPTPPVPDPIPPIDSAASEPLVVSPFDALLDHYEAGVSDPSNTAFDIQEWLAARTSLEAARTDLSTDQVNRLKVADATFVENAEPIATRLGSTGGSHPSSEWWWYPNVIAAASHAQDQVEEVPQGVGRFLTGSALFTALEVIVLVVAVVLLAHNLGVVVVPPAPTQTPTSFPTPVPSPAPTVNAALYDFTTAKLYKSDKDVLEMQVPAAWTSTAQIAQQGGSSFVFTDDPNQQTALASIQIQLSDAKTEYAAMDTTGKANSPQTALQAIIDSSTANAAQSGAAAPLFTPITDVKLGTLAGKGTTVNVAASQNGAAANYYVWLVPVDANTLAFVQARADSTIATQVMPLFDKMLATVVIHAGNVPTSTPTATPLPILLTATQFQATINALTPTNTATPSSTATPVVTAAPAVTSNGTPATAGTPGTPGAPAATSAPVTPTVLADGLQIIDTVIGTGPAAKNGDTLSMKYVGKLADGTVFDSTDQHGGTPFDFQLGAGNVIKGWDEGLVGMKVGGSRTLIIPPSLGYGASGSGPIPANATLTFDVTLVAIK